MRVTVYGQADRSDRSCDLGEVWSLSRSADRLYRANEPDIEAEFDDAGRRWFINQSRRREEAFRVLPDR